jgi:hypothetical protein
MRFGLIVAALGLSGHFLSSHARAETVLDLTSTGVPAGVINGAIYQRSSEKPTGSGVIDAFLRIEGGNNKPYVQGYNTDARSYNSSGDYVGATGSKTQFDEKSDLPHTHDIKTITLSDLSFFQIGGTGYYGFLLDIGQEGNNTQTNLSLRSLQIFQSASGALDQFVKNPSESLGGSLTGATLIYDMDGPPDGDHRVDLQADLNSPGNGVGDMEVFIPSALFNPALQNVYLYSSFGTATASKNVAGPIFENTGSFQEWALLGPGPAVVPVPSAAWGGLALMGAIAIARARNLIFGPAAEVV